MRRAVGLFASAAIITGSSCGSNTPETGPQRNPLALNVAVERQLEEFEFTEEEQPSKEYIAGLGLGIAEECVVLGIAPTSIESVPIELQTAEFYEAYRVVINNKLRPSSIKAVCQNAAAALLRIA